MDNFMDALLAQLTVQSAVSILAFRRKNGIYAVFVHNESAIMPTNLRYLLPEKDRPSEKRQAMQWILAQTEEGCVLFSQENEEIRAPVFVTVADSFPEGIPEESVVIFIPREDRFANSYGKIADLPLTIEGESRIQETE